MNDASATALGDHRRALIELYDDAIREVFGYLVSRCGSPTVAEDLTADTFLAAADAVIRRPPESVTVAWLIGIARHKLADHWRGQAREERLLTTVQQQPADVSGHGDAWDDALDAISARRALATLGAHHRGALTLRYVDGLPVRQVADILGRTEGATEALLVRARAAFRAEYETNHREQPS